MPTATLDAHREQVLRLLHTGRSYDFLNLAEPYLRAAPDDYPVRLLAIRELLKSGLATAARELFNAAPAADVAPELESLRDQITSLAGGTVDWTRRSARFTANLRALESRGVDVATIRSAWDRRAADFTLCIDHRGIPQVRERTSDGEHRWLPFLGDHPANARAQPAPHSAGTAFPGPYLFEGLDLGYLLARIYSETRNTFLGYSCALYVVEPDPAYVGLVLHLHDWRELLSDRRVFWFTGEDCIAALRRAWEENMNLPLPVQAFTAGRFRGGAAPQAVEATRRAVAEREGAVAESAARTAAQYAERDIRHWAARFEAALSGNGPSLRILAAVSMHTTFLQHSMRDAQRALESLGHRCLVLKEQTPFEITSSLAYHQAIREMDPDLFFNLDHLRPEFGDLIPPNLPILTWDQDALPHVMTAAHVRRIALHDFLAGCSKSLFVQLGGDPRQFLASHVPTCPEQFGGEPLTHEERRRYECDVSYVSHAAQTPREFHDAERAKLNNGDLVRLLDEVFALTPEVLSGCGVMRGMAADIVLEEAQRRTSVTVDDTLSNWIRNWYLWRLGDRWFRHEALEWVAEWARRGDRRFRLYGQGWQRHPVLAEFAAGPVENGRELLCVYRASTINLQLMPAGFIHQRALDGLAAGGFFLARAVPLDLLGDDLQLLEARISELGIQDTAGLVHCRDQTLHELLRRFLHPWYERSLERNPRLLEEIRRAAEIPAPHRLFPRYAEILFRTPRQFAEAAERFLGDAPARRAISEAMREVVIARLAYRPTMDGFLRAMGAYLRQAAGLAPGTAGGA
ncbi:MAG: hypothetical protein HY763_14720 [Planctomycetes bacterium]|nr:hypothetical protein [Planctomycetota bacterium]